MSYILEALKRAQAERQLGSAPTLLAVPVGAAPARDAVRRLPAWSALSAVALALVLVLALALAVLAWRLQLPAATPAARTPVQQAAAPAPLPAALPAPPPAVAAAPPLAVVPSSVPLPKPKPTPIPIPIPIPIPAPMPPAAAPEDEQLPSLRDLPEPIQHAVPPLVFGGYMYSKNPADRLLLIDKALRHEGEEVAPGLVLEKLLPKAAVMNYKGYRYRVPY